MYNIVLYNITHLLLKNLKMHIFDAIALQIKLKQ